MAPKTSKTTGGGSQDDDQGENSQPVTAQALESILAKLTDDFNRKFDDVNRKLDDFKRTLSDDFN